MSSRTSPEYLLVKVAPTSRIHKLKISTASALQGALQRQLKLHPCNCLRTGPKPTADNLRTGPKPTADKTRFDCTEQGLTADKGFPHRAEAHRGPAAAHSHRQRSHREQTGRKLWEAKGSFPGCGSPQTRQLLKVQLPKPKREREESHLEQKLESK